MVLSTLHWWRNAVIYQIYIKSFADANGDGIGDIAGLTAHVGDIAALGVDAVWVCPWYVSPMGDGGYDIANHRDIDPMFGTLDEARTFIDTCHEHGLKVVLDLVGNHYSAAHPWFVAALASPVGSPERERFYFRDGRGVDGSEPPTNWKSIFADSAWTRVREVDGSWGQWYLHVFDSSQPDLNWHHRDVHDEYRTTFEFWYGLGADGFRLDAIPAIGKDLEFVDIEIDPSGRYVPEDPTRVPFWDGELVHEVLSSWRAIARHYDPEKFLMGEVVVGSASQLSKYTRPDELPTLLALALAKAKWDVDEISDAINHIFTSLVSESSWPTWVISSHDDRRPVSRYSPDEDGSLDLAVGRSRSRAMHALLLALPGSVCLYQGDELGLENVDDLPVELLQDPIYFRTNDPLLARDGSRVPLPWRSDQAFFGYSESAAWLPQPSTWGPLSRAAQESDVSSMLHFFRAALAARRQHIRPDDSFSLSRPRAGIIALGRGEHLRCIINCSDEDFALATDEVVVLNSAVDPIHGVVVTNSTVWIVATSSPS